MIDTSFISEQALSYAKLCIIIAHRIWKQFYFITKVQSNIFYAFLIWYLVTLLALLSSMMMDPPWIWIATIIILLKGEKKKLSNNTVIVNYQETSVNITQLSSFFTKSNFTKLLMKRDFINCHEGWTLIFFAFFKYQ